MPPPSDTLIVPSNERLCGANFSHFPVGGPTPLGEYVGERSHPWGTPRTARMLYQCESIDGVLSEQFGGVERDVIESVAPVILGDEKYPVRCRTGDAVGPVPVPPGSLRNVFDRLILSVAPFWPKPPPLNSHSDSGPSLPADWRRELLSSYLASFAIARGAGSRGCATPILGAGARGAPADRACAVAAEAAGKFLCRRGEGDVRGGMVIHFAVQDDDVAECLDEALGNVLRSAKSRW